MLSFIQTPIILLTGGVRILVSWEAAIAYAGLMAFFGLIAITTAFQLRSFVKVTQKVLSTLGIPNPEQVDLRKLTKQKKTKKDPVELGIFYFKY